MNSFSETQRCTLKWVWILLTLVGMLPFIISLVTPHKGSHDMSVPDGLLISVVVCAFSYSVVGFTKLVTTIDETGIYYKFWPLYTKPLKNIWTEIACAYVTKYNPWKDYGGWGIKYAMRRGVGTAYTMSGNMGLQLILKNGKKILIGTQRPDEVNNLLMQLKQQGKIDANITGDVNNA